MDIEKVKKIQLQRKLATGVDANGNKFEFWSQEEGRILMRQTKKFDSPFSPGTKTERNIWAEVQMRPLHDSKVSEVIREIHQIMETKRENFDDEPQAQEDQ